MLGVVFPMGAGRPWSIFMWERDAHLSAGCCNTASAETQENAALQAAHECPHMKRWVISSVLNICIRC